MNIIFDIEGNDCTGKSTLISTLQTKYPKIKFNDRGILTKLTDIYESKQPLELPKDRFYIVLDADVDVCMRRIINRDKPRDKYDTFESIYKYRNRFRRLAIKYRTFYIDTSKLTKLDVTECACEIIEGILQEEEKNTNLCKYKLPNPDDYSEEDFNKLTFVAKGNSKHVRAINEKYTLCEFIPTVHSHKQQRADVILGTDKVRKDMTKNILLILDIECIPHAYIYVGEKYVLCERLDPERDLPPVEVIVKRCCLGTDKYRYYEIDKKINRYGNSVISGEKREYPDLKVRFDYRNPNHVPLDDIKKMHLISASINGKIIKSLSEYNLNESTLNSEDATNDLINSIISIIEKERQENSNSKALNYVYSYDNFLDEIINMIALIKLGKGKYKLNEKTDLFSFSKLLSNEMKLLLEEKQKGRPFGDEAMCDDLADEFIDVSEAKKLAKKTFQALIKHFAKMGIYFEDICFMITRDGSKHYYEISQDCGRYKKITEEGMSDMDKDVWRQGNSGDLVYEKWRQMTEITQKYVESIY